MAKKFKVGQEVRVYPGGKDNVGQVHSGCPAGVYTYVMLSGALHVVRNKVSSQQFNTYDYEIFPLIQSEKELNKELEDAQNTTALLQKKIDWLKKTGNKEFDEREFKIHTILEKIDGEPSIIARTKAVKELLDSDF